MCQSCWLSFVTISFWFWVPILVILAQKKAKKPHGSNFGPTDYKNAIETLFYAILSLRKSMGGIAIDIWEKSIFWGSIESQKGAKNAIFLQGGHLKPPPASCRVNKMWKYFWNYYINQNALIHYYCLYVFMWSTKCLKYTEIL